MYWCDVCKMSFEKDICPICHRETRLIFPDEKRIQTVKVDYLFRKFSFEMSFDSKKDVSILIAPNGFGKTTLFHFMSFILSPSYESYTKIHGIPFSRIACVMKDGSEYGVALGPCKNLDTSPEVEQILNSSNWHLIYWYKERDNTQHEWWIDKILKDNLSLYRKQISLSEPVIAENSNAKIIIDHLFAALRERLNNTINVKFIPADRLFLSEERQNSLYSDLNLNNMNETVSKMIQKAKIEYEKKYIQAINDLVYYLADNISISDKDCSDYHYANRIKKDTGEASNSLEEIWKKYSEKVKCYMKLNLLSEFYEKVPRYDKLCIGDQYDHNNCSVILEILLTRLLDAIKPIDDLHYKFQMLQDIINERLSVSDKKLSLYQGKLVIIVNDQKMPLSILSSGEKNDLYLLYELIFSTHENELVFIDEPEISWHIEWQMSFIDYLIRICKENHLQAIVATHSPSIISGHLDSIAERIEKNYV